VTLLLVCHGEEPFDYSRSAFGRARDELLNHKKPSLQDSRYAAGPSMSRRFGRVRSRFSRPHRGPFLRTPPYRSRKVSRDGLQARTGLPGTSV
jgi:hypothetical protein